MTATARAYERLQWMVEQVRSGRPLADVAAEIGWSEDDAHAALRRAGMSMALSATRPPPARAVAHVGEPVLKGQGDCFRRLREPHCALVLGELVTIAERRAGSDRLALRRAVAKAAMATGKRDLYEALLDVAAVAVRWAEAIGSGDASEGGHHSQAA